MTKCKTLPGAYLFFKRGKGVVFPTQLYVPIQMHWSSPKREDSNPRNPTTGTCNPTTGNGNNWMSPDLGQAHTTCGGV